MDKKLIALHADGNLQELHKECKELSKKELCSLIDQKLAPGRGNPVQLLQAIFAGSPRDRDEGTQRRLLVFKQCIAALKDTELSTKVCSELIGILLMETDAFPSSCLAELANVYIELVRTGIGTNGKCLELLPKLLSSLDTQDVVMYAGREMSGNQYKGHVLNSLCSGRWEGSSVLHLAAMFKDVALSADELQLVISRVLRMLGEVDLEELPPLVYQLLLLAAKGKNKLVLEGVTSFFILQDKLQPKHGANSDGVSEVGNGDRLWQVEGTIILHITFAVKQDQDLGREFIKHLKSGQQSSGSVVLSPFNVALALSMARIHRLEEQIFELLKNAVLRSLKDAEKLQDSHWVSDMVPECPDVQSLIIQTVENSVHGWDHVTQGLVQLGFTLMDAFGPKAAFGRIIDSSPSPTLTPSQRACQLGASILLKTFKVHEIVRADILEQILNRVVTKATAPVSHFLELLSDTVRAAPQALLDSLPRVREALDYLAHLPPPTARALLSAIQPLLKVSAQLRDALMLVLRKALFSRHVEGRVVAVNGFLLILRQFRVLGSLSASQCSQSISSSQVQVDVHLVHNPASNEGLCLEILASLRRCLTQQAAVRLTLYEGLFDVVKRNSQLAVPVLQTLATQLQHYYEAQEDVQPPLKLEPCLTSQGTATITTEPLAALVSAMVQCLYQVLDSPPGEEEDEEEEERKREGERVRLILDSLSRRMIKAELEDFELDKSADFSASTGVGVRNVISVVQLQGVYEVLLDHGFCQPHPHDDRAAEVLQLYQKYKQLTDILKEKPGGGGVGGKKGRPSASTNSAGSAPTKQKSMLSIEGAVKLLEYLFSDQAEGDELRSNVDFQRYVVTVIQQKVSQVSATGSCDGPRGHSADHIFTTCSAAARVLIKHYKRDLHSTGEKRDRVRAVLTQILECLVNIVSLMSTRYKTRLQDFLTELEDAAAPTGDVELVHHHVKVFQRMLITVLTAQDSERSPKEANHLVQLISTLSHRLVASTEAVTQVQTWLQRLCTEQNIDDTGVVRSMLSLLLSLTAKTTSCAPLLRDIARDVHYQLGDIDQEVEVPGDPQFTLITPRSAAPAVVLLLLSQMEREMEDTDWVVGRIRADSTMSAGPESPGATQQETKERSVCSRIGHLVNACHELMQSTLPVGASIDGLLKCLMRLYSTLTLLTKHFLWLYQQKVGHIPARYEKLVKLSGTNLTQCVYPMITYIQATQTESFQVASDKLKKKPKKKEAANDSGKAKVLKDSRAIPNLIYSIEQYERFLLQLSKKSKINLMDHFKMSTARDFRINVNTLQAAMEQQESESDGEQEEEGEAGSGQENDEPAAKRAKTTPPPAIKPLKGKGKLGTNKKGLKTKN